MPTANLRNSAVGVEDLVKGGVTAGELGRFYPIVDMLMKVGQRDGRTRHSPARIEKPPLLRAELERAADRLDHAGGEERSRRIRLDPGRQIVKCILDGCLGGSVRVVR